MKGRSVNPSHAKNSGMNMKCPFLKETRVKFCQVSPIKKMIVSDQGDTAIEKCSTAQWTSCPVAQQRGKDFQHHQNCPFLQESFVQYCSLSSVTKFIPYSEAPFSRCSNSNHQYCEHYISLAYPESAGKKFSEKEDPGQNGKDRPQEYIVEGIRMPSRLFYTPNHMWFDRSEDGSCHVGVDAFFTRVFGPVEAVSFVTTKGVNRPSVVLTVNGVDMEVVFPNKLLLTGLNVYLRATPDKLTADPYGSGWLFEGLEVRGGSREEDFLSGRKARVWMKSEAERLTRYVHAELSRVELNGSMLMTDGGECPQSLALSLNRDELLRVFHSFFSPYVSWRIQG